MVMGMHAANNAHALRKPHLHLVRDDGGDLAGHSHVEGLNEDSVVHAVDERLARRCVVDLMQDQMRKFLVPDNHVHSSVRPAEVAHGDDSRGIVCPIAKTPLIAADATFRILEVGEVEEDLCRVGPVLWDKHSASEHKFNLELADHTRLNRTIVHAGGTCIFMQLSHPVLTSGMKQMDRFTNWQLMLPEIPLPQQTQSHASVTQQSASSRAQNLKCLHVALSIWTY